MYYVYAMPNMNPSVGAPENGKQSINLYQKDGSRRTYVSTPENVDQYMNVRKDAQKNIAKGSLISMAVLSGIGAVVGLALGKGKEMGKGFGTFAGAVTGLTAGIFAMIPLAIKNGKTIEKAQKELIEQPSLNATV